MLQGAPPQPVYALPAWSSPNLLSPLPAPVATWAAPPRAELGRSADSRIETFRLGTSPSRIATGHGARSRVVVRAVSQAGQFALISADAAELSIASTAAPSGGVAVVPVGQDNTFYLRGRQALYAKGSAAGVTVSVLENDEAA